MNNQRAIIRSQRSKLDEKAATTSPLRELRNEEALDFTRTCETENREHTLSAISRDYQQMAITETASLACQDTYQIYE